MGGRMSSLMNEQMCGRVGGEMDSKTVLSL